MGVRIGFTSRRPTFHAGTDIGAPIGTAVYAPRPGVVERLAHEEAGIRGNPFNGYGNAVVLYHEDENLWSFYAHLNEISCEVGQHLEPGQLLGRVGRRCNGKFPGMSPHLHFELRHAKADGSSPYPGPYPHLLASGRVNNPLNIEPLGWLESHGVALGRDGWSFDPNQGACPSPQPQQIASATTTGLPRLQSATLELIGVNPGDEADSANYEPPLTMDADLIPFPFKLLGATTLLGLGVFGLASAIRS